MKTKGITFNRHIVVMQIQVFWLLFSRQTFAVKEAQSTLIEERQWNKDHCGWGQWGKSVYCYDDITVITLDNSAMYKTTLCIEKMMNLCWNMRNERVFHFEHTIDAFIKLDQQYSTLTNRRRMLVLNVILQLTAFSSPFSVSHPHWKKKQNKTAIKHHNSSLFEMLQGLHFLLSCLIYIWTESDKSSTTTG